MISLHHKLISAITEYDQAESRKEAKRSRVNIYRLGLLVEALQKAEAHKGGIIQGLNDHFTISPLQTKLLKIAGTK